MKSKAVMQAIVGLSLNIALAAVAADAVWPVPEGHGLRLLLGESAQTPNQALLVSNGSPWPVRIRLMAYDQAGQLLTSRTALVDKVLAVALRELHPQARSLAVVQEPGQGANITLSIPSQSGVRANDSAVSDLLLLPSQTGAAPITLYNPGSEPSQVQISGANQLNIYLKPNQVETVVATPGLDGLAVTASSTVVIQSGAVTSGLLGFREPVKTVIVLRECELTGTCFPQPIYGLHSGRDYMAGAVGGIPSSSTTDPVFAVNFGRLARYINFDQNLGGNHLSHNMGNTVVLEHVLRTGEKLLSLYAHLETKSLFDTNIGARVAKGQQLGVIGCSGENMTAWCTLGKKSNRHVHVEIKKPDLGFTDLWPFGYMQQSEANEKRQVGDPIVPPISTIIGRYLQTVPALQSASAEVLLPFLSRSATIPGTSAYDVFGVAGSPLYAAIALQPTTAKTFSNVGVAGRTYAGDIAADVFLCSSAALSLTSAPLSASAAACVKPKLAGNLAANDYRFYAYSDAATGFGGGTELKFSVLPANSELVDNDGRLTDTTGAQTTTARQGYYVAEETDALDVPGYYLSAKLFKAGGNNFARWFPAAGRTYEVWVHVPRGASTTAVTYKVYPRGRPADGSCSATHATNPCVVSDAVNQASNQDAWVRVKAGTVTQFAFVASATNGAYVGLAATAATSGLIGVDAVKFVDVPPATAPVAPAGLSAVPAGAGQVNLAWTDKSSDETGFKIERRVGTGAWGGVATTAADAVSYSDTGLSPATTYTYQVRAVKGSMESANAGPVNATTAPAAPTAPSGLTASVVGSSRINLGWSDNSSNETGFKIERQVGGGAWVSLVTTATNTVSYADTGLSPATTYTYRLRAVRDAVDSATAGPVSATTQSAVPAAPSGLTATAKKATQVTLAWADNSNNESGFKIERRLGLGAWSQVGIAAANATTCVDGSVTGGRSYGYRLRATNAAGDSDFTGEAKVSTPR